MTGCYIKPFNVIIIFSSTGLFAHKIFICFASSFAAQVLFFDISMTQEISKREIENDKFLGMANYNIYFKTFSNERNTNKFSLLAECTYITLN